MLQLLLPTHFEGNASTCLKLVKIAAISEILQVGAPCSGSIVQTRSAHKSRIPSKHIEVADMCSTPGGWHKNSTSPRNLFSGSAWSSSSSNLRKPKSVAFPFKLNTWPEARAKAGFSRTTIFETWLFGLSKNLIHNVWMVISSFVFQHLSKDTKISDTDIDLNCTFSSFWNRLRVWP